MANVLLDPVEQIIRDFEKRTNCQVTLPARILVQQFFIAVAFETTGFAVSPMDDQARAAMAIAASANLDGYLEFVRQKIAVNWTGEIGLLPLIQNANVFAAQLKVCPWWPKRVP
jgi:hypothetical protein